VVRALAAVVIALVAALTDCIAVDSVRAEDVAFVAAAVILVAAEVTLVAADETVRAATAGAGLAAEARLRRAVVEDDLAVVRAAERRAPVLSARVLAEPARVCLVAARAVVCAGTDFPPS
jgi:hypothetical protein